MKLIDTLIFSLCAIGLVYFIFDRIKYSNIEIYRDKLEKLNELRRTIAAIESDNKHVEKIIKSMNADTFYDDELYDDELTDKLINYRDNEVKLENLKKEQRKIELYVRRAGKYINNRHHWI
ncbi:MAG: hypothetical protein LBV17_04000 [Treponema sp.]|jgi:hypothetical protein|nr:hypothetical protein [Treponema sp.]